MPKRSGQQGKPGRAERALQRQFRDREHLRSLMATRVREARARLNLTQAQLGRAVDRSRSWVAEIEGARQLAPPWLLVGLAKATGRGVGWFYGEKGENEASGKKKARKA